MRLETWVCYPAYPSLRLYPQSTVNSSPTGCSIEPPKKRSSTSPFLWQTRSLSVMPRRGPWGHCGKPNYNQNNEDYVTITCTTLQLIKRWSTASSSTKHIGHAFTIIIFRHRRLSIVRILVRSASQLKAITPGAFNFHRLNRGLIVLEPADLEKRSSWDATQTLLSSPSSWIEALLRISISEKSWHSAFVNSF